MTPRRDEIGAHISIAGGLHLALERGRELGCGAVQIFLKNQRQWAAKPLTSDETRTFTAARRATAIRHVFAHSSYLINLGNPDASLWAQAVTAFTDELERAEALGSGLDRHENIGRGLLGLAPFRLLLNDRRFAAVPKVLETPKEPAPASDLRNLAVLRRLRRRLGR